MDMKRIAANFIQILISLAVITVCSSETIAGSNLTEYSYVPDSDLISQIQTGNFVVLIHTNKVVI
ncbi:MAG: hypothetical protein GY749_02600 [Desulfobacteraceae bacterium]|nr:hypothetical protein [Desulfobacteraceae bacterium]